MAQHYPGGALADFDKAADELRERGFNTVRIDAFPLVIGALRSEDETIKGKSGKQLKPET